MSYYKSEILQDLYYDVSSGTVPSECVVICMQCDKPKMTNGKTIYADCAKLSEKMSALNGIDFVITFYADSEGLSATAKKILMEHEIMHIGFEDGKKFTVPHDLEEFSEIVTKYGVDWIHKEDAI